MELGNSRLIPSSFIVFKPSSSVFCGEKELRGCVLGTGLLPNNDFMILKNKEERKGEREKNKRK